MIVNLMFNVPINNYDLILSESSNQAIILLAGKLGLKISVSLIKTGVIILILAL